MSLRTSLERWRQMLPVWIFPFGFGFVGVLLDRPPNWAEVAVFVLVLAPAFFWSFWRAWKLVMNGDVPILHGMCFVFLPYLPLVCVRWRDNGGTPAPAGDTHAVRGRSTLNALASRTDTVSVRGRQLLFAFMALSALLVLLVGVAAGRRTPDIAAYGFCSVVGCWTLLLAWAAREWFVGAGSVRRIVLTVLALFGWVALGAFVWFVLLVNAAESFGLPH